MLPPAKTDPPTHPPSVHILSSPYPFGNSHECSVTREGPIGTSDCASMPMSETRTSSRALGFRWGEEARSSLATVAKDGGSVRLVGWWFNMAATQYQS
jgi:hypothetical protein